MNWKIFRALLRANLWLLWHWRYTLLVQFDSSAKMWPKVISVETGTGSPFAGTWETKCCG